MTERRVAIVRAFIIEDHGDDLIIEVAAPRGSTRVQIGRHEIIHIEQESLNALQRAD